MLDKDSNNASIAAAEANSLADGLPRPPRGRRSATRPAGPPEAMPAAQATGVTEPGSPAGAGPIDDDPAPLSPAARTDPAEPESAARTARSRRVRGRVDVGGDAATAAPPEAEPVSTAGQPALSLTAPEAEAVPRAAGRRRATRTCGGEVGEQMGSQPAGTSSDIEEALVAVEASIAQRPRRRPQASQGEIDKEQALASLAAVIAGASAESDVRDKASQTAVKIASDTAPDDDSPTAGPVRAGEDPRTEPDEPAQPAIAESIAAGPAVSDRENPEAGNDGSVGPDAAGESNAERSGAEDREQVAAAGPVEADDGDTGHEESEPGSSQRRRRRRGGWHRRRGAAGNDEEGEEPSETTDAAETETTGESETDPGDASGIASSSARRRRRRRRRNEEGAVEEDGDVVVRVREPRRSVSDEVSGIEGSTRLEAKKQRRREGRAAGRHRAPILTEAEFLARRESVERIMLVRQKAQYTQIAVLEDGVLVEHYVDRTNSASLIGNIYLGRVQNVLPSMEAVFIDIGRGRNAVLYAGEVDWDTYDAGAESRKVEQVFKSGQSVLVQVSKDPVGAKGARLTGHVSIPGRYVVYSPDGHLSGISRKLPDSERQRLKQILDTVVADESSVIVRTAAEGASAEELIHDVERLKSQWEAIEKRARQGGAPQQLYAEPDLTLRIIRDTFTEDFRELIVAGDGGPGDAQGAVPSYLAHIAPHLMARLTKWDDSQGDPFAKFRIDEQISKALERKVFLPSGGSLVIDRTEAMTVIDVNTGKFTGSGGNLEETVTRNNLEAAEEIVRQLRLRDLGGIIVIDFIDMVLPSNRELLLRRLIECLGRDRTRHQVSEVTSLGLVQMTRKRIGTGLAEAFTDVCEHCGGRGYLRHDEPVESQAPADGGERHGRQGPGGTRQRARNSNRTGRKSEETTPKASQVQPSEAARVAAAKLAAASRHHHELAAANGNALYAEPDADGEPPRPDPVTPPGHSGAEGTSQTDTTRPMAVDQTADGSATAADPEPGVGVV